jgi:hypothetical protein
MKALRGNGKRALAVAAAALVVAGVTSQQAISSPRAPAQNTHPGFSSSAAGKSMRARHAALAKLGEVAQGAPREGLTPALQIARHFRHEDALHQLSQRGDSFPTPQGLRADGLHWQAIANAYQQRRQMDVSHSTAQWLRAPGPPDLAIARARQQSRQAPVPEPTVVTSTPSGDALDWGDFGIGAGAMLGFALLLTGLGFGAVAMRHRTGKLETSIKIR